jgi:nitrite reductase/ring-hydroxylating ferredoxin subunit
VIGKLFDLDDEVAYRHPEVWLREGTTGPERLRIGGGERPVGLLLDLAAVLPEPLFVLAVLRVPRRAEAGRYESEALHRDEVRAFFTEFEALFADDARVQGWIGATDGSGLVVLDEHDLVYAYGPLDAHEQVLARRGFARGDPVVPSPHAHHYNPELDGLEVALAEWPRWRRILPLADEDD